MKKVLGLLLVTSSVLSMQLDLARFDKKINLSQMVKFQEKLLKHTDNVSKVRIEPTSVFVPSELGLVKLYHSDKGFSVRQDDKKHQIQTCFTDSMVRNIKKEALKDFLKNGYLEVNQMSDGTFSLKANNRVKGGGILGCIIGATVAKVAVSVVGHGAIFIVGGLTGPAAPYTVFALESYFGAAIEAASIKAAIAGGIAGGVATGPV